MAEPSKTDLLLAKLIKAADQDMVQLMKLLEASTKDLNKGTADRGKAERAIKAILKYLGKYKAITTVKSNVLEQLLPPIRAGVLRTDAAYSTLLKNLDALQRVVHGSVVNLGIRLLDRGDDPLTHGAVVVAIGQLLPHTANRLDRDARGDLPRARATHAVRHGK